MSEDNADNLCIKSTHESDVIVTYNSVRQQLCIYVLIYGVAHVPRSDEWQRCCAVNVECAITPVIRILLLHDILL